MSMILNRLKHTTVITKNRKTHLKYDFTAVSVEGVSHHWSRTKMFASVHLY